MAKHKNTRKVNSIIESYPRKRPSLSAKNKQVYASHYIENRSTSGIFNKLRAYMEAWMHKQASRVFSRTSNPSILEVGAGNLNHIQWESIFNYYDIVEPLEYLYLQSKDLPIVRNVFGNIESIPNSYRYDKIISIACLEHVDDLPRLISKVKDLLASDGVFVAAVPCEGELAWLLSWKLVTGLAYRLRHRASYSNVMKHEHLSSLNDIKIILEEYFPSIVSFSFPFTIKHFRLYSLYVCRLQ